MLTVLDVVSFYSNDPSLNPVEIHNLYCVKNDRHSSVVLSTPTILWPRVQIPCTPSMLFLICVIEIVMRKG